MKFFSVCSGIEAASVAWKPLKWECVGVCDIDPLPQAFLKQRYPDVPLYPDMTKLNYDEKFRKSSFELLVGGTPCQSFSVAGKRKGMDDERGRLSLEYCGILDEKQCQWNIWENVYGVFNKKHRQGLCDLMFALTGNQISVEEFDKFGKQGYLNGPKRAIAWRVLDSQFFGVPQRRKRIYIVGYNGENRKAPFAVLFESGFLENAQKEINHTKEQRARRILNHLRIFGTITKSMAISDGFGYDSTPGYITDAGGNRYATPIELERAQGFPDGYTDIIYKGKPISYSQRKSLIGNSMSVPVMYWIGQRIDYVNNLINTKIICQD